MSVESKVPAIRFREYNCEWKERKLLDNFQKIIDFRGRTPKKLGLDWSESGYLALSALNVKNGFIDSSVDAHYGNKELYDKWMLDNELHMGQVLFTTEAPMGNVAQVPDNKKYILSQRTIAFEVEHQLITEEFLAVILQSPSIQKKLNSLTSGGTAKGVSQKSLASVDVWLPDDTKEQTKIGKYFQQLDTLINLHQKKHDKLLKVKKALLEKMFPKQGQAEPEIRFTGFGGEWVEKKLGENSEFSKGQGYSKNDLVETGAPIILYGRLYTKYQTSISKVDTFVVNNGKSILSKGYEVVVPASGETAEDIARASAVIVPGIILGGDLNIIYPNEELNSIFLAMSISNGQANKDLAKRAQGKSVVHVRNNDLKEIDIKYPNIKEQTKIGDLYSKVDTLISHHQTQLKKLNNIKQACLAKMFV